MKNITLVGILLCMLSGIVLAEGSGVGSGGKPPPRSPRR